MRKIVRPAFLVLLLLILGTPVRSDPEKTETVTVRVGRLLDGRGGALNDVTVVIEGSRIVSVKTAVETKPAGNPTWDLRGLTLMPGGIDTHVHIGWHFGRNGKLYDEDDKSQAKETPADVILHAADNAVETVRSGVTTVQSLGAPEDAALRDAIARGILPGPRILTSLEPIADETLTPEKMREAVRRRAAEGADVIKIFASKSIRDGGAPTLS